MLCISASHVLADNSIPASKSKSSSPTFPVNLGKKGTFSFSENATSYRFTDDRVLIKANLGWGYAVRKHTGTAGINIGWLMGESSALGLNLGYQRDRAEAVLHGVKYWLPSGLRWKGSVGYMRGRQDFSFSRSSGNAKLSQSSYYSSVDWLTSKLNLGLQSTGLAIWGGRSKNHSQFDTQTYTEDTPGYYLITRDQRLLSTGRLIGTALDFQYAPKRYPNWVIKGSVGQEWLKFPLSNGDSERKHSFYLDARVDHELHSGDVINVGYKIGVSESRTELGYQHNNLNLSAFHSQGRNGLENQYGVNFTFNLTAFNAKKRVWNGEPLAIKMHPVRHAGNGVKVNQANLLQESILRPRQLPSAFMVKVDPTNVSQIRVGKATLPHTATISPQGDILIPVTHVNGTVTSAQVNGRPVSSIATQFGIQGNQFVIFTQNLPLPVDRDSYTVQINDPTGAVYIVTFDAVNS